MPLSARSSRWSQGATSRHRHITRLQPDGKAPSLAASQPPSSPSITCVCPLPLPHHAGDTIYLCPAEPGAPPFVAHLESLHEQLPASAGGGAAAQAAAPPGSMWAGVRWFYRRVKDTGEALPLPACCCGYLPSCAIPSHGHTCRVTWHALRTPRPSSLCGQRRCTAGSLS